MLTTIFRRAFMGSVAAVVFAATSSVPVSASSHSTFENSLRSQYIEQYQLKYVALGDSVAAGLGLPSTTNPSSEDVLCGRSASAYPTYVASAINNELKRAHLQMSATNVACQGAKADNLLTSQTRAGTTIRPQLDAAFAGGTPALMTLTMGANDAHWAEFISACFTRANCDTAQNTAAASAYLAAMQTKLSNALSNIDSRSYFIPPFVIVTGYYTPISARCVNANLTSGEVRWLNRETAALNNTLRTAAQNGGWLVQFAPVDFTGHDICSADPWIQRPGVPGEPAPFHPTARGQQAIAQAVLESLGL